MNMSDVVNVVLVDDHPVVREGVRSLLTHESNINVVGEASNGKELLGLIADQKPHVAVIDINMPEMDGFETTRRLSENHPDVQVLVLTVQEEEHLLFKIFKAGAKGYVLKRSDKDELVYAVHCVAKGNNFICAEVSMNLLKKACEHNSGIMVLANRRNGFSKREMEVLLLIAEGYTNAEIAEKLFTSRRTIETHRQHLLDKTQAKNTAALISYAFKSGILE